MLAPVQLAGREALAATGAGRSNLVKSFNPVRQALAAVRATRFDRILACQNPRLFERAMQGNVTEVQVMVMLWFEAQVRRTTGVNDMAREVLAGAVNEQAGLLPDRGRRDVHGIEEFSEGGGLADILGRAGRQIQTANHAGHCILSGCDLISG